MKLALVTIVTANLEQMCTFYQGVLAAHAQTHAIKGAFTWGF